MKREKEDHSGKKRPRFSKKTFKKALKIFKFLRPYRFTFVVGMVFLLLSSLASMLFPALMGKLMDAEKGEGGYFDLNLDNINFVAIALLVVFFIQAVFSYFRILLFSKVTENMLADLRQATYAHVIRLPIAFFNENRVGALNSRISSDVSVLQDTFTTTLAEFIRQLLVIVVGVALLAFYSWKLTLAMLALVPALAVGAVVFGKFVRRLAKKAQDEIATSNTIVEETLTAIHSVKAFVNEQFEWARYKDSTDKVKALGLKNAKWRALFASFIIFGMFGAVVLVIWYGLILKENGEISMGELFSFILYSVFVGASFGGIANLATQIIKSLGSTERLMEILDEEQEAFKIKPNFNLGVGTVAFENVTFAYPGRPDINALEDINFSIPEGKKAALVGHSGAGKSTITQLLLRFYPVNEGRIVANGMDVNDWDLTALRGQMAVVPQEVLLFGGSILENIRYGKPGATEEEVRQAAEAAYATEFIDRFPDGFETVVGERGIQLSGGQRQRIAIARAILKNPSLLILDEATSSLDTESEKWVQQALENVMENRTSLIIAHRLSTIKHADIILVLKDGKIVETGGHKELLEKDGSLYKELTAVQLS